MRSTREGRIRPFLFEVKTLQRFIGGLIKNFLGLVWGVFRIYDNGGLYYPTRMKRKKDMTILISTKSAALSPTLWFP